MAIEVILPKVDMDMSTGRLSKWLVADGATVTVGTATVTRTTYPPAAQWPSRNGSYSILLSGSIPSTVTIQVKGATTTGIYTDSANIPTKIYN